MNMLSSTPFPVPTLRDGTDGDESLREFIKFLRTLITDHLNVGMSKIPASQREIWATLIPEFSEPFVASFPAQGTLPWSALQEKAKVTLASFEVIQCSTTRVEGLYDEEFGKKLFAQLLDFCGRMDTWDGCVITQDEGLPTPIVLKNASQASAVAILRCMGGGVLTTTAPEEPMWRTLKSILNECIDISYDILQTPLPEFPLAISLFSKPRIHEAKSLDTPSPSYLTLNVESASQIPVFLSRLLGIITSTMVPSVLAQWFLTGIVQRTTGLARSIFDYCLSPSCATTISKRASSLASVVACAQSLHTLGTGYGNSICHLPFRLLLYRLASGLQEGWAPVDDALLQTFPQTLPGPPNKCDVLGVLQFLRTENLEDQGAEFRILVTAYLRQCIPHLDDKLLASVKTAIASNERLEDRAALVNLIDDRRIILSGGPIEPMVVDSDWRQRVRDLVNDIIAPDALEWMDDDETLTDEAYARRALIDMQARFAKPLHECSVNSRLALADKLSTLPCLLEHGTTEKCAELPPSAKGVITVQPFLTVVARLLDGTQEEVTPLVRRRTYEALACIVRHRVARSQEPGLGHLADMAGLGMTDKDRNVRMGAGHVFVEIIKTLMPTPNETEPFFVHFRRLLDAAKAPVKETVLITAGRIGRVANGEVLGQVVSCLIAPLGQQNVIVKGTAFMQLSAVAKHQKKSAYALVSPYLNQIAPFVVARLVDQPSLLNETCRLLGVAHTDFLSLTLPRTLPSLFTDLRIKVLERIVQDLSTKMSSLFLNHSHQILAHTYMLPDSGKTNQALAFIIQILTAAAMGEKDIKDKGTIDVASVVKSCIVPLLAELVVYMGDEHTAQADMAVIALKRVETTLIVPARGQRTPQSNLGSFLKGYMLGVISLMNDMLQDVQGKKSIMVKKQILRGLGALVQQIGPTISNVAPQIMATMQTMLPIPGLTEVTLETWLTFLSTLAPGDVGPHVGPTSAAFIASWPEFSPNSRDTAQRCLEFIILQMGEQIGKHLDEVVDLTVIPELSRAGDALKTLRRRWTPKERLQRVLERSSSDNLTVAIQALKELKALMSSELNDFIRDLASGDVFDPLAGQILAALLAAACRDGDGTEALRLLAYECIGVLGAVDPDRCEIGFNDTRMTMLSNFTDEGESVTFALHLIRDVLVGAFRSTSDIKYQSHLAYTIQELLRFCKFTPALVGAAPNHSIPLKVRSRWNSLPKHVLETVTPLLEARFKMHTRPLEELSHPIYPSKSTYREWIQSWTTYLITKASGATARTIFGVFMSAVRNKDVGVAHHLLPHLVLNILISGNDDDAQDIRSELLVVLEDQVNIDGHSSSDKKLLSAQAVFMLLDHLNKWVRVVRQDLANKKSESKRSRNHINNPVEEQLMRVDSILSSIDQNLMARAALRCKAYARSLMNFERQIVTLRENAAQSRDSPEYYERLHEIYAHLDEPDGMEGVSTMILSPSLEHQIRQHESTGRWTSAQSCWEVRLQQAPDNLDFHLGLLRCLRNLGHYDTLRTHVKGVLTRNPDWDTALAGFQVEGAWMVGAWADVKSVVDSTTAQTSPVVMARLLLAMRAGDAPAITEALSNARTVLGAPIAASGAKGYRHSYDAVLNLHLTHELEIINTAISNLGPSQGSGQRKQREALSLLSRSLSARLESTLPTFRIREPILSMRRTAFALSSTPRPAFTSEIGRSWLASAKIARKAGQWQTAYSAMLQSQQHKTRFSFMESAKLVKATGEPLRALQELENSMRLFGVIEDSSDVIDLTEDDDATKRMKAKAQVLRARWMNESDRFEFNHILKTFQDATELWPKWESGQYHLGQFHDECFKSLPPGDQKNRGTRMNLYTVRSFAKAIRHGSKYVYQTIPRLLTLWLDMGEDRKLAVSEVFTKLNTVVSDSIKQTPAYMWYTAFPQIVSRVGHTNQEVFAVLSKLILSVIQEYPNQALWLFTSVVKSTKANREQRGKKLLQQLQSNPRNNGTQVPLLIQQCLAMTNELLALCDRDIDDDPRKALSMTKDFPGLASLGRSKLIIPLQESLTASLPPTSSLDSTHQPFPHNAPTFEEFLDEVEIMRSLAKPRKITIRGSNGQIYMFLGKPKDDLRKDARLMDFNAIINKLLKANSESRRRQLHIRTYGVVTLNEECGFIQWVPNTIPIRPVLIKGYDARRVRSWSAEMSEVFKKIKEATDKEAGKLFVEKILPLFPPVFHDWFIETFPEPSAWLASRLAFGRTAAVMSMVGFILGLGDRHCENILLDTNTGDAVHVDFNCLFEKGKTLETPERVPFRLTQNMVDGLGVTGVEGVFRIACEVTMQLLRDNKDSLMSVLDAFIHDPLVEWEDEKRKLEREPSRRNNVKSSVDLHMLAKNALNPIEKKLKGIYSTSKEKHQKEISTSNLVQMLIQEATNSANLGKMYPGWASWH